MNNLKKIFVVFLVFASMTVFVQPALAQETTPDCSRIEASQTRYNNEAARFIQRTHDSHHIGNLRLLKQRDIRETQLINQLDRAHIPLDREFDNLRNRVKTEEQSTAVENYINNVNDALSNRRGKVIDAIVNYRNGTDNVIIERWTKLETSYFQYQADIETVTAKAVSDCEAGASNSEVRQTLINDVRSIKEVLKNNMRELRDFDQTLRDLRNERETTARDANREYLLTKRDLRNSIRGIF